MAKRYEQAPRYERISDLCDRGRVSPATVYRALKAGDLTRYKRGRATLIDAAEADAWLRGEIAPEHTR